MQRDNSDSIAYINRSSDIVFAFRSWTNKGFQIQAVYTVTYGADIGGGTTPARRNRKRREGSLPHPPFSPRYQSMGDERHEIVLMWLNVLILHSIGKSFPCVRLSTRFAAVQQNLRSSLPKLSSIYFSLCLHSSGDGFAFQWYRREAPSRAAKQNELVQSTVGTLHLYLSPRSEKIVILCLCVVGLAVCKYNHNSELCRMCIEAVDVLDVTLDARGKVKEAAKYFCEAKVRADLMEDCEYMMKKHLNRIVKYIKEPLSHDALIMCTYIYACGVNQHRGRYPSIRQDRDYDFDD
ncbi:hypothetical protein Y032_0143g2424 [Ancylostoma ceylanicum]|uniref:Saposin B-type domain-containing protein n=1 Tax=Ancylostoma ceylanicum TaxID=53326 RepID=A0A016T3G9_9BILA|nr:hypothetical protein Y032_0143g2424 [Ancylostoma ceylanicum]